MSGDQEKEVIQERNTTWKFLPKCVCQEQYAFFEGRSILDNVRVAIEIIHHMNCKARGKFGLKINTIKAFEVINGGTRLLFYQKCVFVTNGEVGWGCVWRLLIIMSWIMVKELPLLL